MFWEPVFMCVDFVENVHKSVPQNTAKQVT